MKIWTVFATLWYLQAWGVVYPPHASEAAYKIEYCNVLFYRHMLTIYDLTCATYIQHLNMQTIYYVEEVPSGKKIICTSLVRPMTHVFRSLEVSPRSPHIHRPSTDPMRGDIQSVTCELQALKLIILQSQKHLDTSRISRTANCGDV